MKTIIRQYKEHGKLIIAYDFDGTVRPYRDGENVDDVIKLLHRWKDHAHLICYTARDSKEIPFVKNYLDIHDIPYDYINRNFDGTLPEVGQKMLYNVFLDDKAGLYETWVILNTIIETIEQGVL
jgi:hypothetical protein